MGRRLVPTPERPLLGPLKPLDSALTTSSHDDRGRLVLTIEHDTVRGVAPADLCWWFENLGGSIEVEGHTYPRYLLWHPRDHIHWALARPAPDGTTGQGAWFRIVEDFDRDPRLHVDSTEHVERLDAGGISLVRREVGAEIFRLEHRFDRAPGGSSYRSRMVVGMGAGPLRVPFNRLVRPRVFSDAMGTAWLRHNVEEVGMLEHLLPRLLPR